MENGKLEWIETSVKTKEPLSDYIKVAEFTRNLNLFCSFLTFIPPLQVVFLIFFKIYETHVFVIQGPGVCSDKKDESAHKKEAVDELLLTCNAC